MKLTLDLEPEDDPFSDLTLILFHTTAPNYTFVDDLNHLYRLGLSRQNDFLLPQSDLKSTPTSPSEHQAYPLFSYRDPLRHITYHLIERPQQPASTHAPLATLWSPLQKLLFIQGEGSEQVAEHIMSEFTLLPPTPPADDLAAIARHNILEAFHSAFTPVTLLDPSASLPPDASRKAQRQHTELQQLVTFILQYFELHQPTL